jgi:hypothetical protein
MALFPHPPYFSVSLIEDKTERLHFYMTEVESQVLLNTLTHYNFQKDGRRAGNGAYT